MTTSTPNLALVLYNSTTDSAEYFSNFRAVIAGTSLSSNFYKIDTAYGSMQAEIDDIQAGAYFTLASYISANYYEATVTGVTAYNIGMKIILSLDTASAGTVTLNINSLGIKSVMKIDSTGTPVNISAGELMVDKYYFFAYDGTRWIWVDSTSADQIYIAGTSGNVVTVNSDNTLLGTTTQSSLRLSTYASMNPANGTMLNGKIVPSVTSNNLTVALKTFAGTDPSSTDPIYVTIGNTVRTITSALSVTMAAGTAWCGLGATFSTLEQDFFVYLGFNITDGVVIGCSRTPYGDICGDFLTTSTNEKYAAISTITNAAAGDNYVNIGRFSATLSASASYNWSVPTFSSSNLKQTPTFEGDFKNWLPAPTGYSAVPSVYIYKYRLTGKFVEFLYRETTGGAGTSNATTLTITAPFTCLTLTNFSAFGTCSGYDNSVILSTPSRWSISGG